VAGVELKKQAIAVGGQQVFATEDALEPAEEQFNGPAVTVGERHEFGVEVEAIGDQEQGLGLAAAVDFAGVHFDDAEGLFQGGPAVSATQDHDDIAADPGGLAALDSGRSSSVSQTALSRTGR